MTKPGNRFAIAGHSRKGKKNSPEHIKKISMALTKNIKVTQLCECGCRQTTNPGCKFIKSHQCIGRPSKTKGIKTGKVPWSKGLTKETDVRIAKSAEKSSKTLKSKSALIGQKTKEVWKRPGHKEKVHEAMSGLNHPFYKKNLEFTPETYPRDYPLDWTEQIKEAIRNRDGRICKVCFKLEKDNGGKRLHVHHVDYNKKNLDPENLISLCISCHGKTIHNKTTWSSFFAKKQITEERAIIN